MEHINIDNIISVVEMPKSLKDELNYRILVDRIKKDLHIVPLELRKTMTYELVCYICSICEIFFDKDLENNKKKSFFKCFKEFNPEEDISKMTKRACFECLEDYDSQENVDRFITIAYENNNIIKKTSWIKLKLFLKKKIRKTPRM